MKFAAIFIVAVTVAVATNAQNDRISQGIDEAIALAKDEGARQQAINFLRNAFSELKSKVSGLRGLSIRGSNSNQGCSCPKIYRPVCGNDGNTYGNECLLTCARRGNGKLKVAFEGACDGKGEGSGDGCVLPPCICTADYTPVCGNDGVTYGNWCSLNCTTACKDSLVKAYDGECKTVTA